MNEYWKKRNSELLKIHAQKADDIERELIKEYERSLNGIKKEIETFYARYAGENGISMAEARKQLSRDELKGFKLSLEEFRERHSITQTASGRQCLIMSICVQG